MKKKGYNHVSSWYDRLVSEKGHYYHTHVIIPKVMAMIKQKSSILDLACGQGVLERAIDPKVEYLGIDISQKMIEMARAYAKNDKHAFLQKDLCDPLNLEKKDFEAAVIILSIQDLPNPQQLLRNAAYHLKTRGSLIIVMNHPCFRIPRQSSWVFDPEKKLQYRRVDRYLSSFEAPLLVAPSKKEGSPTLFTYHYSLSQLSSFLQETGFTIEKMEEWVSDKTSEGGRAKQENFARKEFPLFLAIHAIKKIELS